MVGSIITRGIIMVLGYVYPAYECFKSVERNRPDVESLRFWCQYWMIIAMVTVIERVGDALISWVPMYSEAKLAFIIYLWYPRTRGTTYVYSTFLKPFVAKHELEIDRNLNEFRTRAGDWVFHYWQKGSTYFQARFLELLQYIASQSTRPQRAQAVPQAPLPKTFWSNSGKMPAMMQQTQVPHMPPPPPSPPYPTAPSMPRSRTVVQEEEELDYDVVEQTERSGQPLYPDLGMNEQAPYMATRSRNRSGTGRGGSW